MEFFNKIKSKLRTRNLIWATVGIAFCLLFIWNVCTTGFSFDVKYRFGIRGSDSGIPIPNWAISCLFILIACLFLYFTFSCLKSFIKNTEFNQLLEAVQKIGDVNDIGNMLSSIAKNPYTKGGDLRLNDKIVFYLKDMTATVIAPESIIEIRTEITKTKGVENNFVCIYYGKEVLKIESSEKNVLLLLEDIKKCLQLSHNTNI